MLKYPDFLPVARKSDRAYQMVDPLESTTSDNGQTRWDRKFTDVPVSTPVHWILTDAECAMFRTWYANVLRWGAEWFEMPLAADDGREVRECHFVTGYAGPIRQGYDRWRIDANLVLRRLPTIDPDWLLLPEYWFAPGNSIFDRAINRVWPLYTARTLLTEDGQTITTEDGQALTTE